MAKKLKPVLPTLREKKRYVVFEVFSRDKVRSGDHVEQRIIDSLLRLFGEAGVAAAGAFMIQYDSNTQHGLFRVSNVFVNEFRAALAFVKQIDVPVVVRSIGTSGILNKSKRFFA